MRKSLVFFAVALIGTSVWTGAQTKAPSAETQTSGSMAMTDAEVRKVDTDNKKITLRHGEIKNLGMPPMTMVFQVADPAVLAKLKVGDNVKFMAEKQNGALVVTHIEPAR